MNRAASNKGGVDVVIPQDGTQIGVVIDGIGNNDSVDEKQMIVRALGAAGREEMMGGSQVKPNPTGTFNFSTFDGQIAHLKGQLSEEELVRFDKAYPESAHIQPLGGKQNKKKILGLDGKNNV